MNLNLQRLGQQIVINTQIKNESNISGTNPKFRMAIYPLIKEQIHFKNARSETSHYNPSSTSKIKITDSFWIKGFSLDTNLSFAENILYPQDTISSPVIFTEPHPEITNIQYFFVQFSCVFKESTRQNFYTIVRFDSKEKGVQIYSSDVFGVSTREIIYQIYKDQNS